ncbi:MAG: PAS domain S-box-containing protein [Oleiphilaceae bacterium]|jgi:PAS domain S-box-containing protein
MNLYQSLFKQIDDPILILKDEVVLDCNKSLCDLLGEDFDEELIGKRLECLFLSNHLSSCSTILQILRSFNGHCPDVEKSITLSLCTSKNKKFVADVKFSQLLVSDSGPETSNRVHYTIVTIKPQKACLNDIKTINLGGQKLDLTITSLVQFITHLFDGSYVGIAVNDLISGKFIAVNQAFLTPLQYNADELLGVSYNDITPDKYRDIDLLAFDSLKKTGTFTPYQKEYTCKDNSRITVSLYGAMVVQGLEQDFIWSFIKNITDAENINANLTKNLNLLNMASQQTNVGAWELELANNDLQWSDEIYRIFEIDKENFGASYDAFLAAVHPVDRERVNHAYQQSLIDQKPYQIAHRLQMPDGRIKFVNEQCTTSFDTNGNPLVSIGTVQDITAANNSRAELERCPILQGSKDFIGISDLEGRVTFINQSGRDMTGMSEDLNAEVWMLKDLYEDSDQALLQTVMMPALFLTGRWNGKLKLKNMIEGGFILVDCDAFRVDSILTGEPICFAAVSQNITARTFAELELQAYKESLEQRVKDRTIALQQANLKAEQANQAKSVFMSRMSHELRTPLNAVLGFSNLIKKELVLDNVSQIGNIDEVLLAGGHLLNLINELLDISLIESGQINIQNDHINMGQKIQQSIKSLSSSITKKEIKLIVSDFEHVYVKGDDTRVVQVLANVLSNAIKYNKHYGTIEISLSYAKQKTLSLIVKDTGIGIEEQNIARIFDPFERVDYDTYEGFGIGLPLVKELMDLMGGAVKIESSLGLGTTVYLEFIPSNFVDNQRQSNASEAPLLRAYSNIKILYIEDVAANMRLMRRILTKLGDLIFLEAENGKLGIETAKKYIPTIILLDINLPDMNGFEVLKALKMFDQTKDIPVIAVSANAFPEDINCALKQGFDDYITKPFEYNQLAAKVSSFIDGRLSK